MHHPLRLLLPLLLGTACIRPIQSPPPLLLAATPSPGRTAYFAALGTGDYAALDGIIATLTQEADSGDITSRAVLGFAHAWRLSEWHRQPTDPTVTRHAALAAHAFEQASAALPDDPRLVGFRGSFLQARGSIEDDPKLTRQGWFDTVDASKAWPEWGKFTQAYGLITLSTDHRLYNESIELYWDNLDECAGAPVPRGPLDWRPYAAELDANGSARDRRACTNTTVAPHNVEGFFMVFGDHLAKAGDLELARSMYENALNIDDGTWPHRAVAEARVADLQALPERFSTNPEGGEVRAVTEMPVFGSAISCTVCHQATGTGVVE